VSHSGTGIEIDSSELQLKLAHRNYFYYYYYCYYYCYYYYYYYYHYMTPGTLSGTTRAGTRKLKHTMECFRRRRWTHCAYHRWVSW